MTDASPTAVRSDGGSTVEPPAGGDEDSIEWLSLAEDEAVCWRDGPRIQTVLPWAALAAFGAAVVVAAVALEVLSPLGLLWVPVVVAPPLWQYARVSHTAFLVTTDRVAVRSGVLGVTVRTVALDRIQNTTVRQNAIGRLVGYGTVTIETASGSELTLWDVEAPDTARDRLETQRERRTEPAVPGTLEQWEAAFAEIRGWRLALERRRDLE